MLLKINNQNTKKILLIIEYLRYIKYLEIFKNRFIL